MSGTASTHAGISLEEVREGLRSTPKTLPSKYFYDAAGSRLFEEITRLDEYYLTRVELSLLRRRADDLAKALGPGVRLIEPGAGSGLKIRLLLDRLERPAGYVPIDVSDSALAVAVRRLSRRYPGLDIAPVRADFTQPLEIPRGGGRRDVVFFPGSTIGNLHPPEAVALLRRLRRLAGPSGALLIGVDLKKDPAVMERAYDDALGVTARFNRNLLHRLNRELGSDFRPDAFRHRAFYDAERGRIEMHLVSDVRQRVHLGGEAFGFEPGESIRTECSYKYEPGEFESLLRRAGLAAAVFTDERRWFGLFLGSPVTRHPRAAHRPDECRRGRALRDVARATRRSRARSLLRGQRAP